MCFGWRADDWDRLAAGTLAGHLLECAAQITGGYFADPGYKDVPGLAEVGYPIAEVDADGGIVITKPAGTGGFVDRLTVIEQLLYEIHDPAAYLAPDVVLDLSAVEVAEIGKDRVRVSGARGKPAPETLKATVCVDGGVLGEAEISYAGPNAAARAQLGRRDHPRAPAPARAASEYPRRRHRRDQRSWRERRADRSARARANDIRLRFAAQSADAAQIANAARRSRSAVLRRSGRRRGRAPACHAAAGQCLLPDRTPLRRAARHPLGSRGMMRRVRLQDIANARAGDKGNRLNIALVCRDPKDYAAIATQVTAERVGQIFAARKPTRVVRYDLPKLAAFNFVLDDVLEGGVNASLGLDGHGKSLSFLLLDMPVDIAARD